MQRSEINVFSRLKKSSNGRYTSLQGTYNPRVGGTYRGIGNKPKFKSQLELRLMVMLDNPMATNVVSWEYETKRIPYVDKSSFTVENNGIRKNPVRQYVIDFIVQLKTPNGIQKYWIEVKSIHDIEVNKKHKNTKNAQIAEKIRIKNLCKWVAASKAAKSVNAHFIVITEKELDTLKNMIYR